MANISDDEKLDNQSIKSNSTNTGQSSSKTPKKFNFKLKHVSPEKKPRSDHLEVLSKNFGHNEFRQYQWEIIYALMIEKRDVCAVMATGSGKSLCYQFPSVYTNGITIVVSPLIALMEDQVLSLKVSNISACLLGTAQKAKKQTMDEILDNHYRIIYVTPEYLTAEDNGFLTRVYEKLSVDLIAVDEAHCVSTWGHDFRFQYRKLRVIKSIFKNVPILAVTATATKRVRNDIVKSLELRDPLLVCSGFDRPNFYFEINSKGTQGVFKDLKKCMVYKNYEWKFPGATIIYCLSRKQTEQIAELLKSNGVKCLPYHAGLSLSVRKETHEEFVKDKIEVIVATIAFGMGIDKPDVRNIIHYGCAKNIEQYYQEVGRASRDGLPANCVTFYSESDLAMHRRMINDTSYSSNEAKSNLLNGLTIMKEFLETRNCRREFILKYFEDDIRKQSTHNCCDNCTNNNLNGNLKQQDLYEGILDDGTFDFTEDAQKFLQAVDVFGGRYGMGMYIKFLRGLQAAKMYDKYKQHQLFGSGKKQTENWWKALGALLLQQKYLEEKYSRGEKFSMTTVCLSYSGKEFILNNKKLLLPPPPDIVKLLKPKAKLNSNWNTTSITKPLSQIPSSTKNNSSAVVAPSTSRAEISTDNQELYQKLLNKRTDLATVHDCMPYMVASNTALMQMSKLKPLSISEMKKCKLDGFTEAKIEKFAEAFLKIIQSESNKINKKPIAEIVGQYRLRDAQALRPCDELTFNIYKEGGTIEEIVQKRGSAMSTVMSHFVNCMKNGLPISLKLFKIDDNKRKIIIQAIQKVGPENTQLRPIKDECPEEITFDEIKVVKAYYDVRKHLEELKIPYEEFEDFNFNDTNPGENKQEDDQLDMFLGICNEMLEEDGFESDKTVDLDDFEDDDPPQKKQKLDNVNFLLDSPPRRQESQEIKQELEDVAAKKSTSNKMIEATTDKKESVQKNKKVLPPWLKAKR